MTNHVTEEYIAECLSPDSQLRRITQEASFPPLFFEWCGPRMIYRPFFIAEDEIRAAADDLTGLFEILVSLPARLFDGDVARYATAVGFDKRRIALMTRLGGGRPALFGRSDLHHDGKSLKLLEFNVGSQLGGIDLAQVVPNLMEVDGFRNFAEKHQLSHIHMGERIAACLRTAAAPVADSERPVVALVEADGALEPYGYLLRSYQEMLSSWGVDLRLAEVSQMRNHGNKLYLDGVPVDVVLRYFSVNQICQDPNGEEAVEPIFRAHEAGGTVLMTTMESFLFANKGCLALLSDPRSRAAFTPEEAALLDRVLPWTRGLDDGPVDVDGQTVDLLEYCQEHREDLIIKPRNDYGGHGIAVGWHSTDRDWKETLRSCLGGGFIVQERVRQRTEPVVDPATGRLEDWVAVWSTFLTPDGYAGSHIRGLPAVADRGIIGRGANAATKLTGVMTYPSQTGPRRPR